MYLPINEISLHKDFVSVISTEKINEIISIFVIFARDMIQKKLINGFWATGVVSSLISNDKFNLKSWYDEKLVSKEIRQFMRIIEGKYISLICKDEQLLVEALVDVEKKEYVGQGLSFSALNEKKLVVSFQTHSFWSLKHFSFIFKTLKADGNIDKKTMSINQCTCSDDLELITQEKNENIINHISSGQDLWEKWESLFPNLVKCEITKECLYENPEKSHIESIIKQLTGLQKYFKNLQGPFCVKDIPLNASFESETVRTNPEYKKQRLFVLPDGREKYFFWHIKFTGKFIPERLYFLPISGENKCYIAYIGQHLDTKKYH